MKNEWKPTLVLQADEERLVIDAAYKTGKTKQEFMRDAVRDALAHSSGQGSVPKIHSARDSKALSLLSDISAQLDRLRALLGDANGNHTGYAGETGEDVARALDRATTGDHAGGGKSVGSPAKASGGAGRK